MKQSENYIKEEFRTSKERNNAKVTTLTNTVSENTDKIKQLENRMETIEKESKDKPKYLDVLIKEIETATIKTEKTITKTPNI